MLFKHALLAATAIIAMGVSSVSAQPPIYSPPGNDPDGYYSRADQNGDYDRDGQYRRLRQDRGYRDDGPPPRDGYAYYEQGRYEENCRRGNQAAGTVFGAIAGGLIGSAASRGNGGAVVGGAILGGLLGNTLSRDIDCEDQPVAFRVYADGLNGDIGGRYEWRNRGNYGYFTPMREFRRGGLVCREFTQTSYRGGRSTTRTGTACRETSGHWRFD